MIRIVPIVLAALLAAGLAGLSLYAQSQETPTPDRHEPEADVDAADVEEFGDLLRQWEKLPPARRAKLMKRFEGFMSLDPRQRRELMESFREFTRLAPSQQRMILRRYRRFKKLTPEQQRTLEEAYARWRTFDPEKKRRLRRLWTDLKENLPQDLNRLRRLARNNKKKALHDQLIETARLLDTLYELPPVERIRLRTLDPKTRQRLLEEIARQMTEFTPAADPTQPTQP